MLQEIIEPILSFSKVYLPKLIGSALIVLVGYFVCKIINKIISKHLNKTKLDRSLIKFLLTAISICLNTVIILTALANLGISITGLVAAFSAGAVAVALALKDSLSNIAAGIVMLISQPFSTNDYIELGGEGISGKVLQIDIVHTTLLTPDCRRVVIPNGQLVNKTIIDYSKESKRRMDLNFNISYKTDPEKAKEVISEVIKAHPLAMNDPEPFVRVSAHNESAVVITVRVWCLAENYWTLHFDLLEQVREAFDKNGVKIPYNQLDVHIIENKQ